jgi:Mg2+ and Co2+ transporter CorA
MGVAMLFITTLYALKVPIAERSFPYLYAITAAVILIGIVGTGRPVAIL